MGEAVNEEFHYFYEFHYAAKLRLGLSSARRQVETEDGGSGGDVGARNYFCT